MSGEVIIALRFEHGRFHGTSWRSNPFDDPEGEWPPSPWRLVRAIIARSYQCWRESGVRPDFDALVRALVTSRWSYLAPRDARRGPTVKQYHPIGYGWSPTEAKDDRRYGPKPSLVPDASWLSGRDAMYWLLEGDGWRDETRAALAAALGRLTYLGRAESICTARLADSRPEGTPLTLSERREDVTPQGAGSVVRVLTPCTDASLQQLCVEPGDLKCGVDVAPPGARWMYAWRAAGRAPAPRRIATPRSTVSTNIVQLALGFHVPPRMYAWTRLASRFRGAVLRAFKRQVDDPDYAERLALLAGKIADGTPLQGHRHAYWLVYSEDVEPATAVPTRLVLWRDEPFDARDLAAIQAAAESGINWGPPGNSSLWTARVVPLDLKVPPPAGFRGQASAAARVWESATPWIPPRCGVRSNGRQREGLSPPEQLESELRLRGIRPNAIEWKETGDVRFFAVHVPARLRQPGAPRGGHRGFRLRLTFAEPVTGPIILGHSSHFGMGWFRPVPDE